jgi:hypothetical protein
MLIVRRWGKMGAFSCWMDGGWCQLTLDDDLPRAHDRFVLILYDANFAAS